VQSPARRSERELLDLFDQGWLCGCWEGEGMTETKGRELPSYGGCTSRERKGRIFLERSWSVSH
jgi:hypothetical protein